AATAHSVESTRRQVWWSNHHPGIVQRQRPGFLLRKLRRVSSAGKESGSRTQHSQYRSAIRHPSFHHHASELCTGADQRLLHAGRAGDLHGWGNAIVLGERVLVGGGGG